MSVHIHVSNGECRCKSRWLPATRHDLRLLEELIMAKLSTLADTLNKLSDQVDKIKVEVQALKDSLVDVDLPVGAVTALERLTTALQGVDDINPDVPPAP